MNINLWPLDTNSFKYREKERERDHPFTLYPLISTKENVGNMFYSIFHVLFLFHDYQTMIRHIPVLFSFPTKRKKKKEKKLK